MATLLVLCTILELTSTVQARVLVLVASSAAPAVSEVAQNFSSETGIDVRISSASSGTLARQITQGAPAQIYISAAPQWTELLQQSGFIDVNRTRPLLRNRLVIVSQKLEAADSLMDLSKPILVLNRLGGGRLAMGDPSHVPAGYYGRQALQRLGLWPAVRDHLVLQSNVRAVIALVDRGNSPLGIIYATDAALSTSTTIAAIIPSEAHEPIIYTGAVIGKNADDDTLQFFERLYSDGAREIYTRYGFGVALENIGNQESKIAPSKP